MAFLRAAPLALALATATLTMTSLPVQAHGLICNCTKVDATTIRCKGEFSDGSDAAGLALKVLTYEEKVLFSGTLGTDATLTFQRPAGEFYVLLDDGSEHTAEVDHTAIQ